MMMRIGKYLFLTCALLASSYSYARQHHNSNSNVESLHRKGSHMQASHFQTDARKQILLASHESSENAQGKKWEDLTDRQKARIERKHKEFDALPPREKERIRSAREKYRQLPDDRRNELRRKWRDMTPEERARYRHLNEND